MKKSLVLLVCLILFDDCTYKHVPYQHTGTDISNPKAVIKRALESQPPNVAPLQVLVTNEYLKVVHLRDSNRSARIAAALSAGGA